METKEINQLHIYRKAMHINVGLPDLKHRFDVLNIANM
jgi:hypothetical protein